MLAFDARDGLEIDRPLGDGDRIEATEFVLRAVHTPGHASNHLCFLLEQERMLFSGDHIMEGSTVVIRPPDGDMAAYLAAARAAEGAAPAAAVDRARATATSSSKPAAKIDEYLAAPARCARARSSSCCEATGRPVDDIVAELYTDILEELVPMAAGTVWAHLLKLKTEGRAKGTRPDKSWSAA